MTDESIKASDRKTPIKIFSYYDSRYFVGFYDDLNLQFYQFDQEAKSMQAQITYDKFNFQEDVVPVCYFSGNDKEGRAIERTLLLFPPSTQPSGPLKISFADVRIIDNEVDQLKIRLIKPGWSPDAGIVIDYGTEKNSPYSVKPKGLSIYINKHRIFFANSSIYLHPQNNGPLVPKMIEVDYSQAYTDRKIYHSNDRGDTFYQTIVDLAKYLSIPSAVSYESISSCRGASPSSVMAILNLAQLFEPIPQFSFPLRPEEDN